MSYKIDGSSHKTGINGENKVLNYFNNYDNFGFISSSINKSLRENKIFKPFNFIQKGSTSNRQDIYCINNKISISIKSKKILNNKYRGTYDLINTSKIKDFIDQKSSKFEELLNNYYQMLNKLVQNDIKDRAIVEDMIKNNINQLIQSMNGQIVSSIFKKIIELDKNIINVIRDYNYDVNEKINYDKLHFLDKNWVEKEIKNINLDQIPLTNNNSYAILNKDNVKTPFRLRIVLNNGIESLMIGLKLLPPRSNKNNNSILTFKIQVDDVKDVIEKYDVNKNKV